MEDAARRAKLSGDALRVERHMHHVLHALERAMAARQLRLQDLNYSEKIKEVTEKYMQDLEQDKNKYELLREEKNDMEMEYEERLKQMDDKHQHELQELENAKNRMWTPMKT